MTRTRTMRSTAVAWALAGSAALSPLAFAAGPTLAKATVNGRAITATHAYLFHAPDNWEAKQRNAIVILTVAPIDDQAIAAAKVLHDLDPVLGEHIQLEIRNDRKIDFSICHDGLGKGQCYSSSAYPDAWKASVFEEKRIAGSGLTTFTGEEETVFEKYKLFYDVAFDAAWVKDFSARK